MRNLFIKKLWKVVGVLFLLLFILFISVWNGWIGYMPNVRDLQNPIDRYATQIYSADGKVIGTWNMNKENRIFTTYDKISPYVIQALVATEDERFYDHSGVDFIAIGRAIVKRGVMQQKSAGGGSTITQQLAKQLYSGKAETTFGRLMQKPIEWMIAIKLERNFTKEEIMTMYLNYFDFLHNAVGIKNAAQTYFRKDPKNLSLDEAAMLVGMCKNPSYFNPVRHPERCRERRNVVFSQMAKVGYLSDADCQEHSQHELKLNFHRADHKEGVAPYMREYLRLYLMANKPVRESYPSWNYSQFYVDSVCWETDPLYGWCNKNFKSDGTPYNIYMDGLKVYTTLDTRMQAYAESAIRKHIAEKIQPAFLKEKAGKANAPYSSKLSSADVQRIMNRSVKQSERYVQMKKNGYSEEEIMASFEKPTDMTVFTYHGEVDTIMTPMDSVRYYKTFLRAGFVSMEPSTGAVKAYVGGIDYTHFQYDMAFGGRRQVGSTIKPYLYSLAMENGFTPCDLVPNRQVTYQTPDGPWTPRNGSRACYGSDVTLKWGLAQSNNWVSAYLINKLNPVHFLELLRHYGIIYPDIKPVYPLSLGACEVSVGTMVSAYTAFANHGIRCAPMFVTRIEDSNGNVVARFEPRVNEVISQESAYKMLVLTQGVVNQGTGRRLRGMGISAEMGGKTGTTNQNSDCWFMAITPNLVSGCWVGGEDRDIHFDSMTYGQGAAMALPVYGYYIKQVYDDPLLPYSQTDKFDIPAGYDSCNDPGGYDNVEFIENVFD